MKTYSDPELGRMPNVNTTGLNQAAAANKKVSTTSLPKKAQIKPLKPIGKKKVPVKYKSKATRTKLTKAANTMFNGK